MQVEEGRQDPVGEGQLGAAAGSWCPAPLPAPPFVQALFPLRAPCRGQSGGQVVQGLAGQPGERGVGQGGAVLPGMACV